MSQSIITAAGLGKAYQLGLKVDRNQTFRDALMAAVKSHPDLQGLRRWVLFTRDAHELYRQFGFSEARHPDRLMEIQSGSYPAAAAAREGGPTA